VAACRRRVLCGDADSERLGQHAFMGPMMRSLMGPGLRKWIAESIAQTCIAETDDASPIAETDDAFMGRSPKLMMRRKRAAGTACGRGAGPALEQQARAACKRGGGGAQQAGPMPARGATWCAHGER
jgi:hypothetical protein